MKDWLRGGPIAKLFRTFATSPIPPYSKWSICGYMFSYYAIALSWSVSIVSFILVGVYGESTRMNDIMAELTHQRSLMISVSFPDSLPVASAHQQS